MSTDFYYDDEDYSFNPIVNKAIKEGLPLSFDYTKYGGESSSRTVSDIRYSREYGIGYIECYCHLRKERRTFKISRMRNVRLSSLTKSTASVYSSAYNNRTNYSCKSSQNVSNSSGCMVVSVVIVGLTIMMMGLARNSIF